jgi:D-sedoheptulose 7-phosphate isomerase
VVKDNGDTPPEDGRGPVYDAIMELSRLAEQVARSLEPEIEKAAELLANSLSAGGKLLACGNGGSAADAQHMVAELVGRLCKDRPALAGISLTTDPSIMTALGNDYGFDKVFARQVEALGKHEDILLGISTSGHSPNIVAAAEAAQGLGMKVVMLVGNRAAPVLAAADVCIRIPSDNGQRIQELHTAVLHCICAQAEKRLFRQL